MHSFVSFRLSAHICFAASLLCLFAPFRENWQMFAVLAGLVLLAAFFAVCFRQTGPRLLMGLIPALALILARNIPCLLAGLVLTAYSAAFLAWGHFDLESWKYRRETVLFFSVGAVVCLVSTLQAFHSASSRGYVIACVLLALLALRSLRIGQWNSVSWQFRNTALYTIPVICSAAAGVVLWGIAPLFRSLAALISSAFGGLVIAWNSFWDFGGWQAPPADPMKDPIPSLFEMDGMFPTAAPLPESNFRFSQIEKPGEWVIAAVGAAVILALVIWLLRRQRKQSRRTAGRHLVEEIVEKPARGRSRRRPRRRAFTNRGRIRSIYLEYLHFLDRRGVPIRAYNTTADISDAAASLLQKNDEFLRDIYRRARYAPEEPDGKAVAEARAALERLTSDSSRDTKA